MSSAQARYSWEDVPLGLRGWFGPLASDTTAEPAYFEEDRSFMSEDYSNSVHRQTLFVGESITFELDHTGDS